MISYLATIISFINLLLTILTLRRVGNLSLKNEDSRRENFAHNDNDIHNILNGRLLELQNRRYSVPHRRDKHE